jgi:hypothetical protein
MSGKNDSRGVPRIDAAAKAAFIDHLRRGERREDAAAAVGFSLTGMYGARERDPDFKRAWSEALATSAAAERRTRAYDLRGEVRIAPANRRLYQRRRRRNVRFDERRRALFFAHFAWSCDTTAAAEAAGVDDSTVHLHRRTDPAFEADYRATLERGTVLLEAEAVRQRLEAQRRIRAALEAAPPDGPPPVPPGMADEFERVLKLLARFDRKPRRPEREAAPGSRRRVWTFEDAIALLEDRLKALGVALPALPPGAAERYDGPGAPPEEPRP